LVENTKSSEEKYQKIDKESPETKQSSAPEKEIKKPDQQKKKEKKGKQTARDEEQKNKKEYGENFNYIVRLVNTDINGEKNIVQGLTQIKGIGHHMATFIADTTGINRKIKIGNLPETDVEKIKEILENIGEHAPAWMLNYRKDVYTGNNMHLISSDVPIRLRDDINMMKMIRSYRGIRHESGLKVRGQRSSSNGRKGLALGVSKRREAPAATGKKEEAKQK
jgi:small subunit ribosomal protein S13